MLEQIIKWNKIRKFGVEFEFNSTSNTSRESLRDCMRSTFQENGISSHRVEIRGWEHTTNNYNIWVCKTDSSCGFEVCTPPLSGPNDLKLVGKVVDKFHSQRMVYNNQCGLHVHLSLEDFSQEQLEVLLMYWIKIEHNVMNAHPAHRQHNQYCPAALNRISFWDADNSYTGREVYDAIRRQRGAINLAYWGSRKTIEFRMGEMTLDSESVKNRIRFLIWFTDICKFLPAPDNLKLYTPRQMMQLLCLLEDETGESKVIFSPAIESMRNWIINRMEAYMPNDFQRDKEIVKDIKEFIDKSKIKEHNIQFAEEG